MKLSLSALVVAFLLAVTLIGFPGSANAQASSGTSDTVAGQGSSGEPSSGSVQLRSPVFGANGVQLSIDQTDIDSALATARTPQEAARTFAKLVTPAIAQAVAEALQQTLLRTQAAANANANPTNQDMFNSSANSALRLGSTQPNSASQNNVNFQSQIAGWPNILLQNGLLMELHWPSPGLSASGNLPVVVVQATNTPAGAQGPLTITVTGTF